MISVADMLPFRQTSEIIKTCYLKGGILLGKKSKHIAEEKIRAIKEYLEGNSSMGSIAKQLGINKESFSQWVANYESMGTEAFFAEQNKH